MMNDVGLPNELREYQGKIRIIIFFGDCTFLDQSYLEKEVNSAVMVVYIHFLRVEIFLGSVMRGKGANSAHVVAYVNTVAYTYKKVQCRIL